MIEQLKITNSDKLPVSWWKDCVLLKDIKTIKFTDGLNIILGDNGTGKSTILTLLKRALHCEQGYYSKITQSSVDKMSGEILNTEEFTGLKIIHDGQPVFSMDAVQTVGLVGSSFDDDWFKEGISNQFSKDLSSGQFIQAQVMEIFKLAKEVNEIPINFNREAVNCVWQEKYDVATKILFNPTGPKKKKTIIMDEPDRSVSIVLQKQFWDIVENMSAHYQIIVATHSPFAVKRKANYIELQDGVVDGVTQLFTEYFKGE